MLALQLDSETEKRLERLAKLTGRTESSYALEAINEYLDDLEDTDLAVERLKSPGRIFSAEEVKRELAL
jgi:RHH-type rel operon transcriptional repressor/antitoxin RelB